MAANYYKTLGVARTASAEEIRAAYLQLARQYHPDLHSNAEASQESEEPTFKQIQRAYEVLSDSRQRTAYDSDPPSFDARPVYRYGPADAGTWHTRSAAASHGRSASRREIPTSWLLRNSAVTSRRAAWKATLWWLLVAVAGLTLGARITSSLIPKQDSGSSFDAARRTNVRMEVPPVLPQRAAADAMPAEPTEPKLRPDELAAAARAKLLDDAVAIPTEPPAAGPRHPSHIASPFGFDPKLSDSLDSALAKAALEKSMQRSVAENSVRSREPDQTASGRDGDLRFDIIRATESPRRSLPPSAPSYPPSRLAAPVSSPRAWPVFRGLDSSPTGDDPQRGPHAGEMDDPERNAFQPRTWKPDLYGSIPEASATTKTGTRVFGGWRGYLGVPGSASRSDRWQEPGTGDSYRGIGVQRGTSPWSPPPRPALGSPSYSSSPPSARQSSMDR